MMIGRITHFNPVRQYGFITTQTQVGAGKVQQQYFFHRSNFIIKGEAPTINAYVVFSLGDPIAVGKRIQAVGIRLATPEDINIDQGAAALAGAQAGGVE